MNRSDDTDVESSPLLANSNKNKNRVLTATEIFLVSAGYVAKTGFCGLVYIDFIANIEALSANVGHSSVEVGGIFIAIGLGSVSGSISYPILARLLTSSRAITIFLSIIVLMCFLTPFCTSLFQLYFIYYIVGLSVSVLDTGSMTLVRLVQGDKAGAWMTACLTSFTVAGEVSTGLIAWSSDPMFNMFTIGTMGGLLLLEILFFEVCIEKHIEKIASDAAAHSEAIGKTVTNYYIVETLCSLSLFGVSCCECALVSYIITYFNDSTTVSSSWAYDSLFIFMTCVCVSRITLIFGQQEHWISSLSSLVNASIVCQIACIVACVLVLVFPSNVIIVWSAVVVIGLAIGPAGGLYFDICHKLTMHDEYSTTILMVGINIGVLGSYFTAVTWQFSPLGTASLFVMCLVFMVIPFVILFAERVAPKQLN